jgi:hypothetical protein
MSILLSLLGFGRAALSAVMGWLSKRSLAEIGCIILCLVCVVSVLRANHWKAVASNRQAQLVKCQAARKSDRDAYTKAQSEAQAKNQADIQRTEQRQKEISDARVNDLHSRLERIARELRDNPSAKGSAGRSAVPETGDAPCRANDPAWLCLSPADRLRAAQNEERQDQLITWNEEQLKVDPNK